MGIKRLSETAGYFEHLLWLTKIFLSRFDKAEITEKIKIWTIEDPIL